MAAADFLRRDPQERSVGLSALSKTSPGKTLRLSLHERRIYMSTC